MNKHWSVQDAKARLSELLRRAREGEPQRIGLSDGCVVISEQVWSALQGAKLGAWLVDSAPAGEPIEPASRRSRRETPFASGRGARCR
jgi:hypothetical protein